MIAGVHPTAAAAMGMILFDKPRDWTSHDAVEAFRRMLPRQTKVGHCGSLDPLATGLLILLVGPATRLQARMQGLDKVYSGKIRLGVSTDTGDILGRVIEEREVPPLSLPELRSAMGSYRGRLEMPAPAYSAVKHKGKALYKYARAGLEVPVKPRASTVYEWEALGFESPELRHRLACSSGTYVRSLAELLGRRFGCGAAVSELRRESVAGLRVEEALTLDQAKGLTLRELKEMLERSLPRLKEFPGGRGAPPSPSA